MQPAGDIFIIPLYLKAKTATGLNQEMLSLNASRGKQFQFFDIQHVNGQWYCWYMDSVEECVVRSIK